MTDNKSDMGCQKLLIDATAKECHDCNIKLLRIHIVDQVDQHLFRTALTNIPLPSTLETIDDAAFYGCTALTAVEFPASMKKIGTLAYYDCTGIQSIKFGSDNFQIGDYAFVTDGSTLKDKIDMSNLAEGSKVREYVNNIAEPTATEAPETEAAEPEA